MYQPYSQDFKQDTSLKNIAANDIQEVSDQDEMLSISSQQKKNTQENQQIDIENNLFTLSKLEVPLSKDFKNPEQEVKKLQLALELIFNDKIEQSIFKDETEELVKTWQRRNQLDADGIVNQATWEGILNNARIISSSDKSNSSSQVIIQSQEINQNEIQSKRNQVEQNFDQENVSRDNDT